MIELNSPHFITKSFWCMGTRLDNCFGCRYCREIDKTTSGFNIKTRPTDINIKLSSIPVAINLFHGDPSLQIDNTKAILDSLSESGHIGPIIIVTKGDIRGFKSVENDLDIHFALSTFGIDNELDGGTRDQFIANLEFWKSNLMKYKCSIEFRPIIYGINDSIDTIDWVMGTADEYHIPVGYSGLQVKPHALHFWSDHDKSLMRPYPGTTFGYKKFISDDVDWYIRSFLPHVPVFRKTSCLISYTHGLERDYNAHYYRPNEVGCSGCPMSKKCSSFKDTTEQFLHYNPRVKFDIPFGHKVIFKSDHICPWLHNGCSFPTNECSNLSGAFIELNEKVTTSDVRVIKWLTGLTVSSEFVDSPRLSLSWEYLSWQM